MSTWAGAVSTGGITLAANPCAVGITLEMWSRSSLSVSDRSDRSPLCIASRAIADSCPSALGRLDSARGLRLAARGEKLGTSTRITIGPRLDGGASDSVATPSAGGSMPESPTANGSIVGAIDVCKVVRS